MAKGRGRAGRRTAPRRTARRLGLLASLPIALGLLAAGYLLLVYPNRPHPGDGHLVRLELSPGASRDELSRQLAAAGLVDDPRLFTIYLRVVAADRPLREGRVAMRDDLSPGEVARRLWVGGAAEVRVTVPEGSNRFEIASLLEAQGVCPAEDFVAITADATFLGSRELGEPTAEGYLFPDTYTLRTGMPAGSVAARMIMNFRRRMLPLMEQHAAGMARLRSELGFELRDVVKLASIVEEEAAMADERATIAGVFVNRLRSDSFLPRHRLQADPTVSYGCLARPSAAPSCAAFDGVHITRAMLRDAANAYNTYRHEGLPPTPITNPGAASLAAALEPAEHAFLYFVARGHRRHAFSETLDAHNTHVEAYVESLGGSDAGD